MRKFVSDPILYTARRGQGGGGGYVQSLWTVPHDLAAVPEIVRVEFECLIPEFGYSVGDRIVVNPHSVDRLAFPVLGFFMQNQGTGYTIRKDATDLEISFDTNTGASFRRWDSPKNGRPSNGAWQFRLKAFAP